MWRLLVDGEEAPPPREIRLAINEEPVVRPLPETGQALEVWRGDSLVLKGRRSIHGNVHWIAPMGRPDILIERWLAKYLGNS